MHETIIHCDGEGAVAFMKRIDDDHFAIAWSPELSPGRGLSDAMTFHRAWEDRNAPPQSVALAAGGQLDVSRRSYEEWLAEQRGTTVIGSIGQWSTALYPQHMSDELRLYFGFLSPAAGT